LNRGTLSLVIQQSANLTDACERLIEIANERGGEDNITVMLARISAAAHSYPFASANTGQLKLVARDSASHRHPGPVTATVNRLRIKEGLR
jgi:serine/threonine protein phosphatase PrpC